VRDRIGGQRGVGPGGPRRPRQVVAGEHAVAQHGRRRCAQQRLGLGGQRAEVGAVQLGEHRAGRRPAEDPRLRPHPLQRLGGGRGQPPRDDVEPLLLERDAPPDLLLGGQRGAEVGQALFRLGGGARAVGPRRHRAQPRLEREAQQACNAGGLTRCVAQVLDRPVVEQRRVPCVDRGRVPALREPCEAPEVRVVQLGRERLCRGPVGVEVHAGAILGA
jgi:hypothetical protein